jgi:hypothetical protein
VQRRVTACLGAKKWVFWSRYDGRPRSPQEGSWNLRLGVLVDLCGPRKSSKFGGKTPGSRRMQGGFARGPMEVHALSGAPYLTKTQWENKPNCSGKSSNRLATVNLSKDAQKQGDAIPWRCAIFQWMQGKQGVTGRIGRGSIEPSTRSLLHQIRSNWGALCHQGVLIGDPCMGFHTQTSLFGTANTATGCSGCIYYYCEKGKFR